MSERSKGYCLDCQRWITIAGRGVCSGCYSRASREGRSLGRPPSARQRCTWCDQAIPDQKKSYAVFCSKGCKEAARAQRRKLARQAVNLVAPVPARLRGKPAQLEFRYRVNPTRDEIRAEMAKKRCRVCRVSLAGKPRGTIFCSKKCLNDGKYRSADEATRQRVRDRRAAHYLKVRADRLAAVKRYAAAHPEEKRLVANARRARILGNPDSVRVSIRDWRRILNRYDGKCFYCRVQPADQMDHVVPIVRGGRDGIGNVVPACRSCNSSKSRRFVMEWRRDRARRARAAEEVEGVAI